MSSRNQRLSPDERAMAPALYRALRAAAASIAAGATDAATVTRDAGAEIPRGHGMELEYLDIVDPATIQPVPQVRGEVLVAGALWVGRTRLIDNIRCDAPAGHGDVTGTRAERQP